MNIAQLVLEAFESLIANKLRSSLTMLGIVIGVAAVISMLAIGEGAQASITGQINGLGSNLIYVSPGAQGIKNPRPLTMADANALADPDQAPSIDMVAPVVSGRAEVSIGSESSNVSTSGVTPDYAQLRSLTVTEGEFITDAYLNGRAAVAVIGADTAENLFGRSENVVGETFRINGQVFRVIGVLTKKGGSGFGSQDDVVYVPLTTGQMRLFTRNGPGQTSGQLNQILVQATSADTVNSAADEITMILQLRHNTKIGEDDFSLLKQQDILSTVQSITGILTIFLGGIGGISLLVGGIGIMNIMLVSVTERTREIGLRKALGARRRDILAQFLVESSTLSLVGGFVGVLLAAGISAVVAAVAKASGTEFSPVIGISSVLLATIFSAAVGLFFGLYPANRAAKLAPVDALRSE